MNNKNYIDLNKKKLYEDIIYKESTCDVIELEKIIINLFTSKTYIISFLDAKENILKNRIKGYYIFSYPELGSVEYNNSLFQKIYKLSEIKSKEELYKNYKNTKLTKKLRLHSIASLIIKCRYIFNDLYESVDKAKEYIDNNRLYYITFTNPFNSFIKTSKLLQKYTSEEIILMYNTGIKKKFKSIFP